MVTASCDLQSISLPLISPDETTHWEVPDLPQRVHRAACMLKPPSRFARASCRTGWDASIMSLCGSVVFWKSGAVLSIQEHLQISQSSSNSGFMLCTKLPCHHANCRPEPCLNPLHLNPERLGSFKRCLFTLDDLQTKC